jgi:ArsR family transcriptional regulator
MDNYQAHAQLFKVLMHPTRLAILDELRSGEQCVCHMEAKFGLRQAYISQHLMQMRDAGLVIDRRDGWNIFYRVSKPEIYQVIDAMNILTYNEKDENIILDDGSSAKKHRCPCPKCNDNSEVNRHESHDLAMNEVKASV